MFVAATIQLKTTVYDEVSSPTAGVYVRNFTDGLRKIILTVEHQ